MEDDGFEVIPITNLGGFLGLLGPYGHDVEVAGPCDHGEHPRVRQAVEGAGIAEPGTSLEWLGYFICVRDLEES